MSLWKMEKDQLLNLPNKFTLLRFFLSLLLIPLLYFSSKKTSFIAAILFLIASISDFFDGYIARNNHKKTLIGEIMDPMADKTLVVVSLIMLVHLDRVPTWIAALITSREFFVSGLRISSLKLGMEMKVNIWGKVKTTLQMISLLFLIAHYPIYGLNLHNIGILLIYISLVVTLYSGYLYLKEFLAFI